MLSLSRQRNESHSASLAPSHEIDFERAPSVSPSVPLSSTILSFFDFLHGRGVVRRGVGVAWTISFPSCGRVIECRGTKEGYGNHEFNKATEENLYNSLLPSLPPLLLDGKGPWPPPVAPLLRGKCELGSLILRLLYRTFIIFPKMESAQKRGHKRRRRTPPRRRLGLAPGGLRLAVPPSVRGQVGIYDSTPRNPER